MVEMQIQGLERSYQTDLDEYFDSIAEDGVCSFPRYHRKLDQIIERNKRQKNWCDSQIGVIRNFRCAK